MPEGYQFGDARPPEPEFDGLGAGIPSWSVVDRTLVRLPWRRPSDNAADRLNARRVLSALNDPDHWNVIEGEGH